MTEWLFWGAVLLLVHTYFLYPLFLIGLDSFQQAVRSLRGRFESQTTDEDILRQLGLPTVSLVVAAHNEERCIDEKICNTLGLDYPASKLDLVIGSDGSTDGTDDIVRERALVEGDHRIRLSPAPRAGKTTVLNRCIPSAQGDIVVLSDANTIIDAQAVRQMVKHFANRDVGAVCGSLKLFNPTKQDYEESAYWRYESLIKQYEGKQGAVVGANGGLYAIRRSLFEQLPPETIVDDFVIPMRILQSGHRVVYEPLAVAHEETTEDYAKEFGRRTRIAAGNFQSLRMLTGLLSPRAGFRAFAFYSHKILRWFAPAFMLLALLANLALVTAGPFYVATLVGQLLFYALAWAGKKERFHGALRRGASIAHYFVSMNIAMGVGFWKFLKGTQKATWDRTARSHLRGSSAPGVSG